MIMVLLFLFFQLPGAPTPQELISPQARLNRAERVITQKQKLIEDAVKAEADWKAQITTRTNEKNDMIQKVKIANHLDSTWTWSDTLGKFVQK